jgi:PKD repeat protein
VPKRIGLAKQDAIAALQRLTLKYSVVERDVTGVAAGIVADQDPKPGSRASSSTVVTLIVSNGGVTVGKPPVASFDWTPKDARPGIAIKFDASASTDDGKIVKWVWEFGDGTKDAVSGKIASHVYAVPWNYDVTLWVTDDAGNTVSITKKLKVQ